MKHYKFINKTFSFFIPVSVLCCIYNADYYSITIQFAIKNTDLC